ncbi:MAG: prepilin-type N-terminal cleavage/methylation domain-containing protein [bacterium]|nr:prepilin-type N-terminal cleavage/methylation domain-containing protein [bacterium]
MGVRGFTLVEVLIVVVILGILAVLVVPQFSSAISQAQTSATAASRKVIVSKIAEQKVRQGEFPSKVDVTWFASGKSPVNPLFPEMTAPLFTNANDPTALHPLAKVRPHNSCLTCHLWWYNQANGIVRARIPDTGTTSEKISLYNAVNDCNITALDQTN